MTTDRKDPRKVLAGRIGGSIGRNSQLEERARRELAALRAETLRRQLDEIEAELATERSES